MCGNSEDSLFLPSMRSVVVYILMYNFTRQNVGVLKQEVQVSFFCCKEGKIFDVGLQFRRGLICNVMWTVNVSVTTEGLRKSLKLKWSKFTFIYLTNRCQKMFACSSGDSCQYYRTRIFFLMSALPCPLCLCCVYCSALFMAVIIGLVKPVILIPLLCDKYTSLCC